MMTTYGMVPGSRTLRFRSSSPRSPGFVTIVLLPGFLRLQWRSSQPGVRGFILLRPKPVTVTRSNWDLIRMEGAPRVGGNMVVASGPRNLGLGQVLETDPSSKVSLRDENTGEIEVEPGTRLRMFAEKPGSKNLVMERGTI